MKKLNIVLILVFCGLLFGCSEDNNGRVLFKDLTNKEKMTTGKWYKGENLFTGIGYDIHSNGKLKEEIEFKNGRFDGLQKNYRPNGSIMNEYSYKNGKLDGYTRLWYENGNLLSETKYVNGKLDGYTRFWYENGNLWDERFYVNNKLHESKEWDENNKRVK